MTIRILSAEETLARADALAEVLVDAVGGRASVSFMAGFTQVEALAYWRGIAGEVPAGSRAGAASFWRHPGDGQVK